VREDAQGAWDRGRKEREITELGLDEFVLVAIANILPSGLVANGVITDPTRGRALR